MSRWHSFFPIQRTSRLFGSSSSSGCRWKGCLWWTCSRVFDPQAAHSSCFLMNSLRIDLQSGDRVLLFFHSRITLWICRRSFIIVNIWICLVSHLSNDVGQVIRLTTTIYLSKVNRSILKSKSYEIDFESIQMISILDQFIVMKQIEEMSTKKFWKRIQAADETRLLTEQLIRKGSRIRILLFPPINPKFSWYLKRDRKDIWS